VRVEVHLFARTEIRDLLAYLRLAHNPGDGPALARIVDAPRRRSRTVKRAFRRRPVPVAELPGYAQKRGGPATRAAIEALLTPLADLHTASQDIRQSWCSRLCWNARLDPAARGSS
jgi:superfamily I DNA/RNA helicase